MTFSTSMVLPGTKAAGAASAFAGAGAVLAGVAAFGAAFLA